jgi:hypothetical protein
MGAVPFQHYLPGAVRGPVPYLFRTVCPQGSTPDIPKCLIDHFVANARERPIDMEQDEKMITDAIQGRPIGPGQTIIVITHAPRVDRYFFPEDLLTWWRKEQTDGFVNSRDITGDQKQHWFTSPFRKVLGDQKVLPNGRLDNGMGDVRAIIAKIRPNKVLAINRKPEQIQEVMYERPTTAGGKRKTRRRRRKSYRKK